MNLKKAYGEITRHAEKRIRQRLGLPKRAVRRHIKTVVNDGLTVNNANGRLKQHIAKTVAKYNWQCDNPLVYGHHLYMFRGYKLITVLELPNSIKPLAEHLITQKKEHL